MYTDDKNEWTGYIVVSKLGDKVGLVTSSFSLNRPNVEATLKHRKLAGKTNESVGTVTLILENH